MKFEDFVTHDTIEANDIRPHTLLYKILRDMVEGDRQVIMQESINLSLYTLQVQRLKPEIRDVIINGYIELLKKIGDDIKPDKYGPDVN